MSASPSPKVLPAHDVLNSWKEIANYLNRGVRTVQRWEAELAMPVRRPRARSRSAVIALRSEIDEWLRACPVSERESLANARVDSLVKPGKSNLRESISRSQGLRYDMELRKEDFEGALQRLMGTLGAMARNTGPRVA